MPSAGCAIAHKIQTKLHNCSNKRSKNSETYGFPRFSGQRFHPRHIDAQRGHVGFCKHKGKTAVSTPSSTVRYSEDAKRPSVTRLNASDVQRTPRRSRRERDDDAVATSARTDEQETIHAGGWTVLLVIPGVRSLKFPLSSVFTKDIRPPERGNWRFRSQTATGVSEVSLPSLPIVMPRGTCPGHHSTPPAMTRRSQRTETFAVAAYVKRQVRSGRQVRLELVARAVTLPRHSI